MIIYEHKGKKDKIFPTRPSNSDGEPIKNPTKPLKKLQLVSTQELNEKVRKGKPIFLLYQGEPKLIITLYPQM